ncbi:MAG TPA: alkaline phosphatase family protein, partial [Longimicrobiales bacterium]|nr:alkaline phosphatase family protein [Longimicrobiales bacterium]
DQATGGQLMTARSLGEMLAEQGLVYFAASSGSPGSGTLMNHRGAGAGLVHHELTIPDTLGAIVAEVLGPVPGIAAGASSVPLVSRAIDALLLIGLDRADADVMAVWLTEPDGTAHANGIGAPETLEVLADVDAEIGRLLDGLAERGLLGHTNILILSDHGFSTLTGSTSLTSLLVDAGLKESARSTDVVVAGGAIHVRSGGDARVRAIVELLQRTDWVGPVFTRPATADRTQGRIPGTLSFAAIGWNHVRSADILTSAAWTDAENEHGWRGEVLTPGTSGHGSASPWDIRATLIAAGPAIKRGVTSDIPTGNVDVTPTVLRLIGATVPEGLDGRVLEEILVGGPQPASLAGEADVVQASTEVGGVLYELTAYLSRIGESVYFDGTDVTRTRVEGRVAVPPPPPASTAGPPRSRAASDP